MRDSMVFYRSFYEAIKDLDPEDFKKSVQAIAEYALDGKEPEAVGISKTIFVLVKPQIDANTKRFENGSKGGRPKNNQTETKTKPNHNQTVTKVKPNVNVNVNGNVNDKKISTFKPPMSADIDAYCKANGYKVDAERFVDYYESKGWIVGKTKMKDWKATVRNWSRSNNRGQERTAEGKNGLIERDYDMDALEKQLLDSQK